MMAVGNTGLEARAVARLEHGLAAILDQNDFAFEHIDELVLLLMPMAQRRGRPWLESRQIDAELRESRDVAECRLLAALGDTGKWLRVDAGGANNSLGNVDLGHDSHSFDDRCCPHASANAQRHQRGPEVAPLQFV